MVYVLRTTYFVHRYAGPAQSQTRVQTAEDNRKQGRESIDAGKSGFRTGKQGNQGSQPDTAFKPGFTGLAQSPPGFRGPKTIENRVERDRKQRKQGSQTRKRADQGSQSLERAEPGFPGSGAMCS